MAHMVSYVVCMILAGYDKTGVWPHYEDRAVFVDRWLERKGHVAPFWTLSMLALAADSVARTVIGTAPDIMDLLTGDTDSRDEILVELVDVCRTALCERGLAA